MKILRYSTGARQIEKLVDSVFGNGARRLDTVGI